MQIVASGIQRLHEVIGCTNEGPQSPDTGRRNGLLSDLRRLREENKYRDERSEMLQVSVNHLIDIVNEDVRQNAETRNDSSESALS